MVLLILLGVWLYRRHKKKVALRKELEVRAAQEKEVNGEEQSVDDVDTTSVLSVVVEDERDDVAEASDVDDEEKSPPAYHDVKNSEEKSASVKSGVETSGSSKKRWSLLRRKKMAQVSPARSPHMVVAAA